MKPTTLIAWAAASAFLILVVLVLRALLGKRVSARLRYALWAVVLLRLLVPVQLFPSPLAGTWASDSIRTEQSVTDLPPAPAGPDSGIVDDVPGLPVVGTAPGEAPAAPDALAAPALDEFPGWTGYLGWVWLAGSAVMALALVASNRRFFQKLRRTRASLEGVDCPLPVYAVAGLPSPCLFGIVRPAVYVTAETAADPAMLRHVLAHEYTHFRHGDHIWNILRSAALAVHWWDPLVWLAVVLSRRDCELACDEGALRRLGDGERVAYGRTLLALLTGEPRPADLLTCATTMTGGQKSVFERVARIARAPKRWLWAAVAAVLMMALASACAFGSMAGETPTDTADTLNEIAADLSFSLERWEDGELYVRMTGSVDGVELPRGAHWDPEWKLSMVYPDFSDGIEGHVAAWWTDETRTSVTLSTRMSAMLSSSLNVGYWEFTVDAADWSVLEMTPRPFSTVVGEEVAHYYPASIAEEEAVQAARVAAKLLTAAEDYYRSAAPEADGEPAAAQYRDILLGEGTFLLSGAEPAVTLDEALGKISDDPWMDYHRFAVADLDGDGADEVLLYACGAAGDLANYILLDQWDGEVYGTVFGAIGWRNRWFENLKADGTFECTDSLGTAWASVSYLRSAAADSWTLYSLGVNKMAEGVDLEGMMVLCGDGTPEEYQAALTAQTAKADAVWYDFTPENIGMVFPA